MKKISLLALMLVVLSCNKTIKTNEEVISKIQNSNYKLFDGVTTEARNILEGVYKAPTLTKEFNGKDYLLPNFSYYGCNETGHKQECLKTKTTKRFDIIEFSSQNDIVDENEAYIFVDNFTSEIFNEFEKISVYSVISRSLIGDCIIFNIDENNYVAYVPNVENIYNEFWKSRFIPDNKIGEHWYAGER